MIGPKKSTYQGGTLFTRVFDGNAFILGCAANGGFVYTQPNITCPSGTTGLVTQGDFDGDGVRDVGRYFSVSQPVPARNIEPFQTGLVELYSAPPSDLPRPLGGFNWLDNSTVIFFMHRLQSELSASKGDCKRLREQVSALQHKLQLVQSTKVELLSVVSGMQDFLASGWNAN